eukprot:936583_1
MDAVAAKAIEEMTKEAGEFLFDELDDTHTEEQVKAIIDVFPESLSIEHADYGHLPIYYATHEPRKVSFIPLLAKEGLRLNVGGEESRGGLIYNGYNSFLGIALLEAESDEVYVKYKQVLEKLREMGLFKKEDIKDSELLLHSADSGNAPMFEMLTAWDPDSLVTADGPLLHRIYEEEKFEMVLKAGMEYFPERLGFLFRKYRGKTACETAFDNLGVNEAMKIICKCIPPIEDHSLIHRAIEVASHLENKLIRYYPNEAFKRDATGRTLPQVKFHTQLREGTQTYENDAAFFANALDDQIEAKDPRSGLFPFMVAASDNRSDLDAVYYLLKRCPQVLVDLRERDDSDVQNVKRGIRKRQREES